MKMGAGIHPLFRTPKVDPSGHPPHCHLPIAVIPRPLLPYLRKPMHVNNFVNSDTPENDSFTPNFYERISTPKPIKSRHEFHSIRFP